MAKNTSARSAGHMDEDSREERASKDERMQETNPDPALFSEHVDDDAWKSPMNLTAPPPRPGYTQRWVRVAVQSEADVTNLAKSFRQGFRPRRIDSVEDPSAYSSISHGEHAGVIGVHGMILCERPVAVDQRHRDYLRQLTDHQTRAVTSDLEKIEHKDMPITIEMTSRTERGKRPKVAPDAPTEST